MNEFPCGNLPFFNPCNRYNNSTIFYWFHVIYSFISLKNNHLSLLYRFCPYCLAFGFFVFFRTVRENKSGSWLFDVFLFHGTFSYHVFTIDLFFKKEFCFGHN